MPRKVLLFSGHMVDYPGREKPRLPPDREPVARAAIARALSDLELESDDLAICCGASGADLLFAEAALARAGRFEIYIPFDQAKFLSVDFAEHLPGTNWRPRFFAAKSRATLRAQPIELGPVPMGAGPYERNNRWMLKEAARFGPEKVEFVCLWEGEGGDGPGGTKDMMKVARRAGGRHTGSTRGSFGGDIGSRRIPACARKYAVPRH